MKYFFVSFGYFAIAVLLSTCDKKTPTDSSTNTRDIILNEFLKSIDSMPYYDTSNINYKFLRAYKENDTLRLKKLNVRSKGANVIPWTKKYLDPCANKNDFDTLTADEAYRFEFYSYMCEYFTVATITQRGGFVKASSVVYKNAFRSDSLPCSIAQQNEIHIDNATWLDFKDILFYTDFWGLKEYNNYDGLDGSTLTVLGYQKMFKSMEGSGPNRAHVFRWSRSMDGLTAPFLMILRVCKINSGCIRPG